MAESKLGKKGQVTVPTSVRAALGLKPGDRLQWNVSSNGDVVVRAQSKADDGEQQLLRSRLKSVSRAVKVNLDDL